VNLIVHPIFQLSVLGASLLGALALFVNLKRENAALRRRLGIESVVAHEAVESMRTSLRHLEKRLEDQQGSAPAPAFLPGASMNLTKRGEALRLHRRGEPAERIASALQLPRNEVELLLKVHRTVVELA